MKKLSHKIISEIIDFEIDLKSIDRDKLINKMEAPVEMLVPDN